ncbi:MAG: SdrD B-like domain-containing protein [Gemmataceae bacterium]
MKSLRSLLRRWINRTATSASQPTRRQRHTQLQLSQLETRLTPTGASLGDFVWNDVNGDGIQNTGELGISGVKVNLLNTSLNVLKSTTTSSTGIYHFTDLTAGTYVVEFVQPGGYAISPALQGPNGAIDSDPARATGRTREITLGVNEINDCIDAGMQYCPAALGDFVWLDKNCNGIQDKGEAGVAGVTVNLLDSTGKFINSTKTNSSGAYSFNNLSAGTFTVEFVSPDGYIFSPQKIGTDGAIDSNPNAKTGRTDAITLAAGETNICIDAGLCPRGKLGDFVWLDTDCDGIQDAGEAGVSGITVKLLNGTGTFITSTTTNGSGAYSFDNLDAGNYIVEFVLPTGYTFSPAKVGTDGAIDSNPNVSTGRSDVITLAQGEVNVCIDAGLCHNKAKLGDFVWLDTNCNGLQDAGEVGVANVTVKLLDNSGNFLKSTTTNANGLYSFDNLDAGTYLVEFVSPSGYIFAPQKVGTDGAVDSNPNVTTGRTDAVTLAWGENNPSIDAGLCHPKAKLGDYVWLDTDCDGVQDAGETGVANVTVNLLNSTGKFITSTKTSATGLYSFDNLDAGTYTVEFVSPSGYIFSPQKVGTDRTVDSNADTTTGRADPVTLAWGETNLTIDAGLCHPKAKLADFVWLDTNCNGIQDPNEPGVANIKVNLLDNSGKFLKSTTTDANGLYFFDNLDAGTYTVEFIAPSGKIFSPQKVGTDGAIDSNPNTTTGRTDPITLAWGEYNPCIDAGLCNPPVSSIRGTVWCDANNDGVRNNGDLPIGGVLITLLGNDNTGAAVSRQQYTGADGTYIFTGLTNGTYQVNETQPAGFDQGFNTVGSVGGSIVGDSIKVIPLPSGTDAYGYDFGEKCPNVSHGNKEDLLASAGPSSPTLLAESKALPYGPQYANGVVTTRLANNSIIRIAATGQATGGSGVRVFDYTTGVTRFEFNAYPGFTGGVRVAVADVTGDGVPDLITAPGAGGGPHIKVFNGKDGSLVSQFYAYDASFHNGVYVAAGDVNGDGVSEIITAAGEGGGPHVRIFNSTGTVIREFFAYDPSMSSGVRIAVGDVNADGKADIVTAPGAGANPHVRVFNGNTGSVVNEFFAYNAGFLGGLFIAAGDVDGDGKADVITGAGSGGGPHVRVFKGGTNGAIINEFFAYEPTFLGGVRVAALDINGDGKADVITAPASNFTSFVQVRDVSRGASMEAFLAYDSNYLGGAFVAAGTRRNLPEAMGG